MKVPKAIQDMIDSFSKLPGIGPKTAQRLAFYLLHVPQADLDYFADSLINLKKSTLLCSTCKNVAEKDPCGICSNTRRDQTTILVVESPLDVLAFEKAGKYEGVFHVLHGSINPLENIGPDEIYIDNLFTRINKHRPPITEIIIATNPNMEGEATAMYLNKKLKELANGNPLTVTRLGMGIPTGADVEYADEVTLTQAIEGRRSL